MRQNRVHAAPGSRTAANRLLIVAGVALLWITAVFGRLAYLQLFGIAITWRARNASSNASLKFLPSAA